MSDCRARDPIWDALVTACGPAPEVRSARGAWNRAAKELRDAGYTPGQIITAAACYREAWPHIALTPPALAKHIHLFVADETPALSFLWVDPVDLGNPNARPIVLAYPDGSTARGRHAVIHGPSELVYRPEGYPDGKHVAIETPADVELVP